MAESGRKQRVEFGLAAGLGSPDGGNPGLRTVEFKLPVIIRDGHLNRV